jgi:hypothetical protein
MTTDLILDRFYVLHTPVNGVHCVSDYKLQIGVENYLVDAEVIKVTNLMNRGTRFIDYLWKGKEGQIYVPSEFEQSALSDRAKDLYDGKRIVLEKLV